MEEDRNPNLLIVSDKQKAAVRLAAKIEGENDLQIRIDSIAEWFKMQQHLPKMELDHDVIERILVSRKGSVEKAKTKIDMMFTVKCLVPDLAAPRDILHSDIQESFLGMIFTPLPILNHDYTRVNLYRYTTEVESYNFRNFLNYLFMTVEYRLKFDYAIGDRSLIDFQYRSLAHMTKETPGMIKNCEFFIRKAYGVRLLGLHIINAPSFLNSIINMVKSGLSSKLSSRIHVHPDYDDLYQYIDRHILPLEYGGDEKSAVELVADWQEEFTKPSIRENLKKHENLKSDESKRIGSINHDLLGISTTFKTLEID